MVNCSILGCKSRSEQKDNITFHGFPTDVGTQKLWIIATGRKKWHPTKYTRLCSKHFDERCFRKTAKLVILKVGSIPTFFVHGSFTVPGVSVIPKSTHQVPQRKQGMDLPTSNYRSLASSCMKRAKRSPKSDSETETDSDASRTALYDDDDDDYLNHSSQRISLATLTDVDSYQLQVDYYCNGCRNVISGYRYICVECSDFDLCSECEVKGLHELHYMLRVPRQRTHEDITTVLEKIREELFEKRKDPLESIKVEVKQEPDPLGMEEEIDIDYPVSTDNHRVYAENRLEDNKTNVSKLHRCSTSPSKNISYKSHNAPSTNVPFDTMTGYPKDFSDSVLDIKIEDEDTEGTKCEVFVHKDTDRSSPDFMAKPSNCVAMLPSISNVVSTDQLAPTVPVLVKTTKGKQIITKMQRTGSIVTLDPETKSPLIKRYVIVKPGRRQLNTIPTDTNTNKNNLPGKS